MGKLEFVILGKIVEIIIYQAGRKNFLLMNGIQIKNKVIELFFRYQICMAAWKHEYQLSNNLIMYVIKRIIG